MSEGDKFDSPWRLIAPLPIDMVSPVVKFRRLPHGEGLPLPSYATPGAAGLDLIAAADVMLLPGVPHAVATGFQIEIPPGFEGQVRPRSGMARDLRVTVANAPGTIDSDYRGELQVLLVLGEPNARFATILEDGACGQAIKRGDRIAQLVIAPVARAEAIEVEELSETERGEGGFGSTGR